MSDQTINTATAAMDEPVSEPAASNAPTQTTVTMPSYRSAPPVPTGDAITWPALLQQIVLDGLAGQPKEFKANGEGKSSLGFFANGKVNCNGQRFQVQVTCTLVNSRDVQGAERVALKRQLGLTAKL